MEEKYKKVREALVRLVGSDDLKELEGMKQVMAMLPDNPETENVLFAINTIIETHENSI